MDLPKRKKTWKRETAAFLMFWCVGIITYLLINGHSAGVTLMVTAIPFVFGCVAMAFFGQVMENLKDRDLIADLAKGTSAPEAPVDPVPPAQTEVAS